MVGRHIWHKGGPTVHIGIPDTHLVAIEVSAVFPPEVHNVEHINPNLVPYIHVIEVVCVILPEDALADPTNKAGVI